MLAASMQKGASGAGLSARFAETARKVRKHDLAFHISFVDTLGYLQERGIETAAPAAQRLRLNDRRDNAERP
jgi:hypothetical protein